MEFGRKLIDREPGCKQNRACFVKRLDPGLNVFVYTLYFVIYYRAIQRCKRTTAAKISAFIRRWHVGLSELINLQNLIKRLRVEEIVNAVYVIISFILSGI